MINFNELFTRYGKLISNDYLNSMHKKKIILLILPLLFLSSKISALPACDGNFVRHCYGTIFHQNGEKYVGEIKDNKYNGKGSYLFINGNVYIGEFKDGLQNGQGTFTFANGDKYEGGFKNGYYHGKGSSTFSDGENYTGDFVDDLPHGKGTLTFSDGSIYI